MLAKDQPARVAAAYYYHKPVVVTRAGGRIECVQEGRTGRVVVPGHPATLARCLDELLDDPARLAEMGAAGRAWYDAHRAQEEQTLIDMYSRLVENRSAGRLKDWKTGRLQERRA